METKHSTQFIESIYLNYLYFPPTEPRDTHSCSVIVLIGFVSTHLLIQRTYFTSKQLVIITLPCATAPAKGGGEECGCVCTRRARSLRWMRLPRSYS